MSELTSEERVHRARAPSDAAAIAGVVRYAPLKSIWFSAMIAGAIGGCILRFSWVGVALFVASTAFVLLFGHSLGSHRKLVHDSFQCPKWLEYALVYLGVQVGLAGPLGLLRQHELRDFAQRLPDCHDYLRHGQPFWRDAWWQLHCELVLDQSIDIQIEAKIGADRFYLFLERTWLAQHGLVAFLAFTLGGWEFVCWGVCARVAAAISGHWLIGYLAHNHGKINHIVQNAAVQGRNIRFASLITMGECWHNNHHAFPGSARLGLLVHEWDPGWWVLRLLERFGLVWALRLPSAIAPRDELVYVGNIPEQARELNRTAHLTDMRAKEHVQ